MTALLPVGTIVRVTERRPNPWPHERGDLAVVRDDRPKTYIAKVVGYDLGRTKYELGQRYVTSSRRQEWRFLDGGAWAFPSEVEELKDDEA